MALNREAEYQSSEDADFSASNAIVESTDKPSGEANIFQPQVEHMDKESFENSHSSHRILLE